VHKSGNNKKNIDNIIAKGWGKVNQILALVKEAPLGSYRVRAGLLLRQAMLLNGTLFNSEAWHSLSSSQVDYFDKLDQCLLRGLLGGHSKIPVPSLYLETSQVPLRYILSCRRILYLHTILQRSKDDLIRRVYDAQKDDPSEGDFCQLVKKDLELIEVELTEEEIETSKRGYIKAEVKRKAQAAAFKYLIETKETKSKMDNLEYDSFTLQSYLTSPLFTAKQALLLLALRTRTVRGIRSDFGAM